MSPAHGARGERRKARPAGSGAACLPRRTLLAAALGVCAGVRAQPGSASGPPPELSQVLPEARVQGSCRLRVIGLHVYDARLWVGEQPVGDEWMDRPFALELEYARSLKGSLIAERSLQEMQRQDAITPEAAQRWLNAMRQLFPDVGAGDRITGVHLPGRGARFYVNGGLRGESRESDFVRLFFGIWLSPRTSEPALRDALLGRARS